MKLLAATLGAVGFALFCAGAVPLVRGEVRARASLEQFAQSVHMRSQLVPGRHGERAADAPGTTMPAAVLRIDRIGLEVPVHPGTGEDVLVRGAGLIEGTAAPGSDGNVGIAAHRDRQFRRLGELVVGDRIRLESADRDRTYRVTRTSIVEPHEVGVLDPTSSPALTLVTCYPFRFVGAAPQRFIVRAEAESLRVLQPE
jgi:sortase A